MLKGDRLIIAIVICLALVAWPAALLASGGAAAVRHVTVTGPGVSYDVPLTADRRLIVPGLRGDVTVVVRDGSVAVVDSSCPDRLCVSQGAVSRGAIVCAPNGVTVRIGGDGHALDAQVR